MSLTSRKRLRTSIDQTGPEIGQWIEEDLSALPNDSRRPYMGADSGPSDYFNLSPRSQFTPDPTRLSQLQSTPEPDFRVAVDFGTTYTTIAYIKRGEPKNSIHTIDNFPEDRYQSQNGRQVPSESVYFLEKSNSQDNSDCLTIDSTPSTGSCQETGILQHRHGYEAQRYLEVPSQSNETVITHIHRMKLLLDNHGNTQHIRHRVKMDAADLIAYGFIKSEEDVIQHLLTYYFLHTKEVLERDHGYNERSTGM
jgi:hypothetical protein